MNRTLNILGTRGVPGNHGGFETFASRLAPYLVDRGWTVNVYCQLDPDGTARTRPDYVDQWEGVNRLHLRSQQSGSRGSLIFDARCVKDVLTRPGVDLVLGYNTAIFTLFQRLRGRRVVINMDGVEWRRAKWSFPVKCWFYINEFVACHAANVTIADHPEISQHLKRHGHRNANIIPYGADAILDAPDTPLGALGLERGRYLLTVARVEPENSALEVVRAFSKRRRNYKLVMLGTLDERNCYHRSVKNSASDEVIFPGPIYDPSAVAALRYHAAAYIHGHQVGGTNPSLVEALGAGCLILARDNRFNRWVAGPQQTYFSSEPDLATYFDGMVGHFERRPAAQAAARERHSAAFTWATVLGKYESLLDRVAA